MLNFGASKPRVKGGARAPGAPPGSAPGEPFQEVQAISWWLVELPSACCFGRWKGAVTIQGQPKNMPYVWLTCNYNVSNAPPERNCDFLIFVTFLSDYLIQSNIVIILVNRLDWSIRVDFKECQY